MIHLIYQLVLHNFSCEPFRRINWELIDEWLLWNWECMSHTVCWKQRFEMGNIFLSLVIKMTIILHKCYYIMKSTICHESCCHQQSRNNGDFELCAWQSEYPVKSSFLILKKYVSSSQCKIEIHILCKFLCYIIKNWRIKKSF